MNLFKFHRRRDEHRAKTETSQQLLAETNRTEPEALEMQRRAQELLAQAEQQAKWLRDADHRNHYSEGLTQSMRGKPA